MIGILIYHAWLLFQLNFVLRNKTVSFKEILNVFAVGATVAVLGNLLIQGVAVRFLGSDLVYYTVGPVTEEVLKISFVVFLLFFTRLGKTTGISDAILLAAAAGSGYGFTEDAVRAVGFGLTKMVEWFPAYDLKNIFQLFALWLPSERAGSTFLSAREFIAGHLMWTALVGFGVGIARKFGRKNILVYLLPIGLLLWVIVDHSLANYQNSWLSFLYPLYGRGMGIRYALTLAVIVALVLDEILVNRYLPKDEKLLLPSESKRSLLGELRQMVVGLFFGKKHWFALAGYFQSRRQLAFMIAENGPVEELKELLKNRRDYTIASVQFGVERVNIPSTFHQVWQGPDLKFTQLNANQKILAFVVLGLFLTQLYNLWLLLFSAYLPRGLAGAIVNSPLTMIVGVVGYLMVVYQMIAFYRNKQWQKQDWDNRIVGYTNALLTHTAVFNILWSLPFFFGKHPLLQDKFLWSQFLRFIEFYKSDLRPWLGGTLSASINFLPIIGNIKSGFEAWTGYDYLAGKEVKGVDRLLAVLGAIPVAGNILRAMRYLPKSARLVQGLRYRATLQRGLRPFLVFDKTVGKWKGRIDYFKTVGDDYQHAVGELRKQYEPIEQMEANRMARERDRALEKWVSDNWLKQVDTGHYQKTIDLQEVDIFTGKALNRFPDSIQRNAGQVTVDQISKTVVYDGISTNYSLQGSDGLVNALGDLQKQYPGSTIIYNQMFKAGARALHVLPPEGRAFMSMNLSPNPVGNR